jgi:AbrB family looped-hinge helix DNA binding protein
MNISITKMSSKGQIVIPIDMREGLKEGDKMIIIKNKDQLILKKVEDLDENFKEDIEFANKTEQSYQRYKKGEFKKQNSKEFLNELEKW